LGRAAGEGEYWRERTGRERKERRKGGGEDQRE
jgi:hypothetical protein